MSISLSQYLLYLQYMGISIIMLLAFGAAYHRITPAQELRLIKNGNLACALSLGGALVGFCLPLASSIAHSVNLPDFVLWGLGAAVLQILVYFAATRLLPDANRELEDNNVAVGALFGSISIAIGLLNAACLS
ncbi:MAG: DUF350 domain-containing protein [Neisseria sp.]|nr:DUF350 domain-containing protein [Neisseria sp.]